jgi:hypothetical protein
MHSTHFRFQVIAVRMAAALALFFAGIPSRSDQAGGAEQETVDSKGERAARLDVMRRRAASLTVEFETPAGMVSAEMIESAILRYGTPARLAFDETLWAWGRVGRPVAIATIGPLGCEIVSVADEPVLMKAKSGWKWSPAGSGIQWTPVPEAPAAGRTAVIRLRQMNEISRRFSATASNKKASFELRIMDHHLHRYADPEHGLIDGAIFAFVEGTNPEVFLLLECRQERGGDLVWSYGCTRMSAATCKAMLNDKVVWQCSGVAQWNAEEPYFSTRFGEEDTVAGDDSIDAKEK